MPSSARRWLLWGAAFLLVYAILCWAPPIYDDRRYFLENPLVHGPWPGLRAFLDQSTFGGQATESPLTFLLHRLLYSLAGEHMLLCRLTSLLLHAANVLLFYRVCRRLLDDADLAFAAAALFSLFPTHVEVLAISTYKTHLIVSFCALLVMDLQAREGGWWRDCACWAALVLAALFKESAVVIPFLALLVDRLGPEAGRRRNAALHAGLFAIAGAYLVLRVTCIPLQGQVLDLRGGFWANHLLTSAKVFLWDLGHLLLPWPLSLEHDLRTVRQAQGAVPILAALAAVAFLSHRLYRRDRLAWGGWVWAALALGPFLNLVPHQNFSLVSDRYLYLASAGYVLALARLAGLWSEGRPAARRLVLLAGTALAACYGALALRHGGRFLDPVELWTHAVERAPRNFRTYANLGEAYRDRGLYEQAASVLSRAIELAPQYPDAHMDLALTYASMDRLDDAIAEARRRVALLPDFEGTVNLGAFLLNAGRPQEALPVLRQAVQLKPDSAEALIDLGLCASALRRWDEALDALDRATRGQVVDASQRPGLVAAALAAKRAAYAARAKRPPARGKPAR